MDDHYLSTRIALGYRRAASIDQLYSGLNELDALAGNAATVDMHLLPVSREKFEKLKLYTFRKPQESWLFARDDAKDIYICVDDASSGIDSSNVFAAIFFPELHTRLVSWWLVHAWRFMDLTDATLDGLREWRITISAVASRALIEEVGCLLYEAKQIAEGWRKAKSLPAKGRPQQVRDLLHPLLAQTAFGSRGVAEVRGLRPATNVQTYVDKLAKASGEMEFLRWYAWLSNAAHPAVGSRIAYASQPLVHETDTVVRRRFTRRPTSIQGKTEGLDFLIAHQSADATISAVKVGLPLLWKALEIVDDVGLTTHAATFTEQIYWRNLKPVRGNRWCPCGKGRWKSCQHDWGSPAPEISITLS